MSVVFFTHIQRTGGTSIRELLGRNYGPDHFLNTSTATIGEFINMKYQMKLRCVAGHLYYGVHELLACQNPIYLTFLRNPVDRVVSYYARAHETTRASHHHLVKKLSLSEYCSSDQIMHNIATAAISGYDYKKRCLESALENMERYLFVGIQEMFLESSFLLCKKLRLQNWVVGKLNYTNRSLDTQFPIDEVNRFVTEFEADDVALYEEARKRFTAEMASLTDEDKIQLENYRRIHENLYKGPIRAEETSSDRDKLVVKGDALDLLRNGGIDTRLALSDIHEFGEDVERLSKYFAS